jgi:hypothetical protein
MTSKSGLQCGLRSPGSDGWPGGGKKLAHQSMLIGMGDPVALRLCLDRIYPARKDRPVTFALPVRPWGFEGGWLWALPKVP